MTRQIAVRLPEDLVVYLDEAVASGRASSRASIVARALQRDRRRAAAERDLEILRETGPSDGLDELVEWATKHAEWDD